MTDEAAGESKGSAPSREGWQVQVISPDIREQNIKAFKASMRIREAAWMIGAYAADGGIDGSEGDNLHDEVVAFADALEKVSGWTYLPRGRWKISRPCYDKAHRCPGSVGGGMKTAKFKRCVKGYITYGMTYDERAAYGHDKPYPPHWWSLGRCKNCDVVVLPSRIMKLDPQWWISETPWRIRRLRDRWRYWREDRRA